MVILSCKAYDLDGAMESVAPAVGPDTAVVPLLNGMRHLDALDARFGPDRVLGGSCFISAKLDDAGRIAHVSDIHRLVFGERAGGRSPRVDAIAAAMAGAKFEAGGERPHRAGDVGEVGVPGGPGRDHLPDPGGGRRRRRGRRGRPGGSRSWRSAGRSPRRPATRPARSRWRRPSGRLTDPRSAVTASMLGDVERRGRTEADHILGDLLPARRRVGRGPVPAPAGLHRRQGGGGPGRGASLGRTDPETRTFAVSFSGRWSSARVGVPPGRDRVRRDSGLQLRHLHGPTA